MNNKQLKRYYEARQFFYINNLEGYCTLVAIAMLLPMVPLNKILEKCTNKIVNRTRDNIFQNKLECTYDILTRNSLDAYIHAIKGLDSTTTQIDEINQIEFKTTIKDLLNNDKYKKGKYIFQTGGHAFAVMDGVILDRVQDDLDEYVESTLKIYCSNSYDYDNYNYDIYKKEDSYMMSKLKNIDDINDKSIINNKDKLKILAEYYNYDRNNISSYKNLTDAIPIIVNIILMNLTNIKNITNIKFNHDLLEKINILHSYNKSYGTAVDKIMSMCSNINNRLNMINFHYGYNSYRSAYLEEVLDYYYKNDNDNNNNNDNNPVLVILFNKETYHNSYEGLVVNKQGKIKFYTRGIDGSSCYNRKINNIILIEDKIK